MVHYIAIALPKFCPVLLVRPQPPLRLPCSIVPPVTIMAQIILAILLASATAAMFGVRRASRRTSQGRPVPCLCSRNQ